MNPFRYHGRTPGMGDRPIARTLQTQDSITQKKADINRCFEWDSNAWSQCSSGPRLYAPKAAQLLELVLLPRNSLYISCMGKCWNESCKHYWGLHFTPSYKPLYQKHGTLRFELHVQQGLLDGQKPKLLSYVDGHTKFYINPFDIFVPTMH
jgi:hypothetical protein